MTVVVGSASDGPGKPTLGHRNLGAHGAPRPRVHPRASPLDAHQSHDNGCHRASAARLASAP
jgi:hypothetical protein